MESAPIMEPSESVAATVPPSDTSKPKRSKPKDSKSIPLDVQLQFIQQTVFDYQQNGGKVDVVKLPRKEGQPEMIAVVLQNVDFVDGSFVAIA